jgi:uncharacterized protein (TIGR02246 family)
MRNVAALGVCFVVCLVGGAATAAPPTAAPSTVAALEKRVQELEDRAEIQQLLIDYGRALDTRDFETYAKLFATDGEWSGNVGTFKTFKGPQAIKAAMEEAFKTPADAPPAPGFVHLLTNAVIEIRGDHATAVSKWTFVTLANNKPGIANIGRYEDTLVREQGRWKFRRRVAPSELVMPQ